VKARERADGGVPRKRRSRRVRRLAPESLPGALAEERAAEVQQ